MKGKLKVGLMVESLEVPRWVRHMVERIAGSSYAALELIVVLDPQGEGVPEEAPWQHMVEGLYMALERWWVRVEHDALQETGLGELLGQARVLRAHPVDQRGTEHLPAEVVAAIHAEDLDVLFLVPPRRLGGEVLRTPRFGVWTCRHGVGRSLVPAFREVMRRNPVTESRLEVVAEETAGEHVLYRSYASTHHWSVARNCSAIHWKAVSFFPRVLEQLWLRGPEALVNVVAHANDRPLTGSAVLPNGAVSRLIMKALLRRIHFIARRLLWREQWILLRSTASEGIPVLRNFQEMLPPRDRFWADPHLLVRDGKHYLFLEEAPLNTGKGHIAVMVLNEQGRWSGPTTVLEEPYHLSNPFVFEQNGDIYMVPESAANRSVDLYRCERFPDRWVHVRTILSGLRAVDATLFSHGAKCWMFVNVAENPEASTWDELFLFHASDPVSGEWTPHPRNPIVSDVRCARPAGALFVNNGAIIRPAQDCAERYGRAVHFMRIDRLDETDYTETAIGELRPGAADKYLGVHTFSRGGALSIIDAIRRRPPFVK